MYLGGKPLQNTRQKNLKNYGVYPLYLGSECKKDALYSVWSNKCAVQTESGLVSRVCLAVGRRAV